MNKSKIKKELFSLLLVLICGIVTALTTWVFVLPAKFAPNGVDGITVMLYEVTGINAGVYSLCINLPLLLVAWFILKKRFVIYTVLLTVSSSVMLIAFENISFYQYTRSDGVLIAAIYAGALFGIRAGIMLRLNGSTGGIDIVARMITKKYPHLKIEKIIAGFCYLIVLSSYFVYKDLNCILLSIVKTFVYEKALGFVLRQNTEITKFRIVTKSLDELRNDIIRNFGSGITLIDNQVLYPDNTSDLIVFLTKGRQSLKLLKLLQKYPDTFFYCSDISQISENKYREAVKI